MLAISIYGLPAHPFVVHLAVVLVPLAAIATIAVGWNARWRHRYYLPIALVAIIGAVGAFLAQQTGGSLRRALRQAGKHVGNHPQQGNVAFGLQRCSLSFACCSTCTTRMAIGSGANGELWTGIGCRSTRTSCST